MLKKTSCLLPLVLLCGVGQAGISVADGPRFIGRVPKATVELVGITDFPPNDKSHWWLPDGSAVWIGPFRLRPQEVYRFLPGTTGMKRRAPLRELTFLAHIQDPSADPPASSYRPTDISATRPAEDRPSRQWWPVWQIIPLDSFGNVDGTTMRLCLGDDAFKSLGVVDRAAIDRIGINSKRVVSLTWCWWQTLVVDASDHIVPNYHMYHAVLFPSAQMADLRVGIATGTWETVITQKPNQAGTQTFNRDGTRWWVTFQRATVGDAANTTWVWYKTPLLRDHHGLMAKRLVAVAQDGTVIEDTKHNENAEDQSRSAVACYHLPLSSIKECRFQVCPYDWVEFKNVSVRPGQKTDVKVLSPDAPVNTDK